jgi:hypothetical protein
MGLIDKFFGGKEGAPGSASTQFRESEPDSDKTGSRNTRKRELVQVVLRDTMRKHGVPSDWVECRMLSSVSRTGRHGLHVNFVVKHAHDRLLAYVFAFQDSFERELTRFEPRARDWLLSIGWEFVGFNAKEMPDPNTWAASGPVSLHAPLVNADWKPEDSGFGAEVHEDAVDDANDAEPPKTEDDVQSDLLALFAIRDAAIADTVPARSRPPDATEFQATQAEGDDRKK